MRKLAIGLLLVLFVPVGAACNNNNGPTTPPIPASFNFSGEVRLSGAKNVFGDLSNCSGIGPYVDLYNGAFVTVTNEVGKPIAIGKISKGLGTNYYQDQLDECTFGFYMVNVPRAKAYLVVLARTLPVPFTLAGVVATKGKLVFDANPPLVRPGVSQ